MLNETLFPQSAPALGKVGALGLAFLQFVPCLSLIPVEPYCVQLRAVCNCSSSKGSEREGEREKSERW